MTRFDGADISHYQNEAGPINWQALKNASLGSYFACKATQRANYLDPFFSINRNQSLAVGFEFRLFYHWLSPSNQAPIKDQVNWYLNKIGTLEKGEGVMLDAEESGITAQGTIDWCNAVEQKVQKPCAVYTGAYVAGLWTNTTLFDGKRGRHLAAYTTEAKALQLPGVNQFPWDFWQYSSNGPVPGITGRCDMNRIDNVNKLQLICGNEQKVDDVDRPYLVKDIVNSDGTVSELYDGHRTPISGEYLQCFGPSMESGDPQYFGMTSLQGKTIIHLIDPNVIHAIPLSSNGAVCKFVPTVIPPYPTHVSMTGGLS